MKNKETLFILLSAYSIRTNNIASKRIEKMAKYLSFYAETILVNSVPNRLNENNNSLKFKFEIGNALLIEVPTKRSPTNYKIKGYTNSKTHSLTFHSVKKELYPILSYILPFSTGGMLFHDASLIEEKITNIIKENLNKNIVLFTSYDPWFVLKMGFSLKKKFPQIFWVADFRDPSFDCHEGIITRTNLFRKLTKKVLKNSNLATVVSKKMEKDYKNLSEDSKVLYLPNGFDEEDLLKFPKINNNISCENFLIVYTGSLHSKTVDIIPFVKALILLKNKDYFTQIKVIYAGKNGNYVANIFKNYGILSSLKIIGDIDRTEALKLQNIADLLLLITYTGNNRKIGNGIVTGKFYEYISTNNIILAIGTEDWEMKELLESDGVSKVFDWNKTKEISNYIETIYINKVKKGKSYKVNRKWKRQFEYKYISNLLYEEVSKQIRLINQENRN